jgi:hypothetical protein
MNLNDALAALSKAPVGSFIARPNGPTVRMSRGNVEHSVHRYVVDLPEDQREYEGDSGVRMFDASEDDIWAGPIDDAGKRKLRDDWELTKRELKAKPAPSAPPTREKRT